MSDGLVILYVEDNPYNRKLVSRVLQIEGYIVHGVADGYAGLEFVAKETPDLILMDINLPEIDGYEMTTKLRQMPHLNHVPIIALTANVLRGDREKTIEAGCDGYIQKPIDIDRLPGQIAEYLARKH